MSGPQCAPGGRLDGVKDAGDTLAPGFSNCTIEAASKDVGRANEYVRTESTMGGGVLIGCVYTIGGTGILFIVL